MTTLVTAAAMLLIGSDPDSWEKVKSLKSGTELRVYKIGVQKPMEVRFDDLGEESLIVATKKEQVAIPRDEILRIEARAPGSKVQKTSQVSGPNSPNYKPPAADSPMDRANSRSYPSGNDSTVSSGLSIGKPGYETVYQKK